MMDTYEMIIQKIDKGTVTCADFDKLIAENLDTSIQDKIRRRVHRNPTDSHIDKDGHQPLSKNFMSRVIPKRQPSDNQKNNGRGDLGREHSAETVKKKYE